MQLMTCLRWNWTHALLALERVSFPQLKGHAPLTDSIRIPALGRSPIYIGTFIIFVILTIPTALVHNFAGLLVLRFLGGFFGRSLPKTLPSKVLINRC